MNAKERDRRRFLKEAVLGGVAAGALGTSHAQTPAVESASTSTGAVPVGDPGADSRPENHRGYGQRSHYETIQRWPVEPDKALPGQVRYYAPTRTPLQHLQGTITP